MNSKIAFKKRKKKHLSKWICQLYVYNKKKKKKGKGVKKMIDSLLSRRYLVVFCNFLGFFFF